MHEAWDCVSRPPVYEGPEKAGESNGASVQSALVFCIASPFVEDRHPKEKKEEAHSDLQG